LPRSKPARRVQKAAAKDVLLAAEPIVIVGVVGADVVRVEEAVVRVATAAVTPAAVVAAGAAEGKISFGEFEGRSDAAFFIFPDTRSWLRRAFA
jgi:hypothetical protein